ncbi:hypothetical protein F5Y13DRAFT_191041 [Hypoxylon sp. FL1857]|nr:hypothetical protein F5Y13DRAFT_191041 [Hypoxylon sp. FL1857]
MAPNADPQTLSVSDQKFFATIIKYLPLPSSTDLDWDAFAKEMGFKDVKIARIRFGQIRRKYDSAKSTGNGTQDPLKATKSAKVTKPKESKGTGKGRGKKGGNDYDHNKDDEGKGTVKEDGGDDANVVVKKEDDDGNED